MTGNDPLPLAARPELLDRGFDVEGLHAMREALMAHARALGVPPGDVTQHLLMTAAELAANAVTHGGGTGRLRVWREGDRLYCEVSDRGPGFAAPPPAGAAPPDPHVVSGRGLWIIRQLCDQMVIANGPVGARVTAVLPLSRVPGHEHPGDERARRDRGAREYSGHERGGREYGGREYGGRDYIGRDYIGREYGGRDHSGREYGGRDHGGRDHSGHAHRGAGCTDEGVGRTSQERRWRRARGPLVSSGRDGQSLAG